MIQTHANINFELRDVSFRYEKELILEDISFSIKQGDYVGIIGPNGSGKTTLLKILLGILQPVKGELKIFGEMKPDRFQRSGIGYVPQRAFQTDFPFPANIHEIVANGLFPKKKFGLLSSDDKKRIQDTMEMTGLWNIRSAMFQTLSGGQKQKVYMAQALISKPKILILDEPSTGVDISAEHTFFRFIKTLNEQKNITVMLVSHDLDIITNEVKYVICLNRKLMCHTPVKEFVSGHYIEKLYGQGTKFVKHRH